MNLTIIGAGLAGRSLAAEAVGAGHCVVLEDVLPSKLRTALQEIETKDLSGSLAIATTIAEAVREADIVVDFVPDELESKLEIVSMVDRMAPPRSVLCIPTRALSLNDVASCTYRSDRCIAVQTEGRTARLITGVHTSDETVQFVQAFWASMQYTIEIEADPLQLSRT